MDLPDVIRATTATPARRPRRAHRIGALAPGREADLTGFELRTGHWALPDAAGATETVERLLVPRLVVRAGHGPRPRPRRRPARGGGDAADRSR